MTITQVEPGRGLPRVAAPRPAGERARRRCGEVVRVAARVGRVAALRRLRRVPGDLRASSPSTLHDDGFLSHDEPAQHRPPDDAGDGDGGRHRLRPQRRARSTSRSASVVALSALVTAEVMQSQSVVLAVAAGLGVGLGVGALNGLFVTLLRLPSFLVTLATLGLVAGLARSITDLQSVAVDERELRRCLRLRRRRPDPGPRAVGGSARSRSASSSSATGASARTSWRRATTRGAARVSRHPRRPRQVRGARAQRGRGRARRHPLHGPAPGRDVHARRAGSADRDRRRRDRRHAPVRRRGQRRSAPSSAA